MCRARPVPGARGGLSVPASHVVVTQRLGSDAGMGQASDSAAVDAMVLTPEEIDRLWSRVVKGPRRASSGVATWQAAGANGRQR